MLVFLTFFNFKFFEPYNYNLVCKLNIKQKAILLFRQSHTMLKDVCLTADYRLTCRFHMCCAASCVSLCGKRQ